MSENSDANNIEEKISYYFKLVHRIINEIDSIIYNLGDNIDLTSTSDSTLNKKQCVRSVENVDNIDNFFFDSKEKLNKSSESKKYLEEKEPIGLKKQFKKLHDMLYRSLIGTEDSDSVIPEKTGRAGKPNISALLMGPRGSGKTLVLERCVSSMRRISDARNHRRRQMKSFYDPSEEKNINENITKFRIVRLNGILLGGHDVGYTVREIVRQLSHIAIMEYHEMMDYYERLLVNRRKINGTQTVEKNNMITESSECTDVNIVSIENLNDGATLWERIQNITTPSFGPLDEKFDIYVKNESIKKEDKRNRQIDRDILSQKNDSHKFRTRFSSFNSTLALLDQVLRISTVDSIPVLVVLDELDAFLGTRPSRILSNMENSSTILQNVGHKTGSCKPFNTKTSLARSYHKISRPSDRQLLLYHLLDRVTDYGSSISFVGITSRLSTVGTLEKRVKSRAEGTSRVIYFGHSSSYKELVDIILSKFNVKKCKSVYDGEKNGNSDHDNISLKIRNRLRQILLLPSERKEYNRSQCSFLVNLNEQAAEIRNMFIRNYRLGKDLRWFSRLLSTALSLMVEDFRRSVSDNIRSVLKNMETCNETSRSIECENQMSTKLPIRSIHIPIPSIELKPTYLLEGLVLMSGTHLEERIMLPDVHKDIKYVKSINTMKASRTDEILLTNSSYSEERGKHGYCGAFSRMGKRMSSVGWDSPRIQSILDMSGSQVAVLLSARRILLRDEHDDEYETPRCLGPKPITYLRIWAEYMSYFLGSGRATGPDRYKEHIFYRSFCHIIRTGLIKPVIDHAGGGPMQYSFLNDDIFGDPIMLKKLSLYVNIDLHGELTDVLKNKMLDCTTSLREWGLQTNG